MATDGAQSESQWDLGSILGSKLTSKMVPKMMTNPAWPKTWFLQPLQRIIKVLTLPEVSILVTKIDEKRDVKMDSLKNHHFKVPRAPQRGKGSAKASKTMLLGVQGRVKIEPFF